MTASQDSVTILMAEDDPDDRMMTERAWKKSRAANELRIVNDGVELMDYLLHRGEFADPETAPTPGLILIDLNMPRMDGREAIRAIRSHPKLRCIPIVILTTSREEEDIIASYELGVNSYITKPVTFAKLVEVLATLGEYWVEIVQLPPNCVDR